LQINPEDPPGSTGCSLIHPSNLPGTFGCSQKRPAISRKLSGVPEYVLPSAGSFWVSQVISCDQQGTFRCPRLYPVISRELSGRIISGYLRIFPEFKNLFK